MPDPHPRTAVSPGLPSVGGSYRGILCIGDPHLASRVPGFRSDDYPRVVLGKLEWCLEYAARERLLPAVLGDWFHYPRDNANWLIAALCELLDGEIVSIYGNHDCSEDTLGEDDSLSILVASRRIRLVDDASCWHGEMSGRPVVIGGTSWRQPWPVNRARESGETFVLWLGHHDVRFPGYDFGERPYPIRGVDVFVNGHLHAPRKSVVRGETTWLNPGNISRVQRADVSRARRPSVLRIDVTPGGWTTQTVEVPHRAFDEVFHPQVTEAAPVTSGSVFVRGLSELESWRTESGAGLAAFLDENLDQFDEAVAGEIRSLAGEVLDEQAD